MAQSVVIKQSIVAIFGLIIPEPLAIPPTVTSLPATSIVTATFLGYVSVVIIASAAVSPQAFVSPISGNTFSTPESILSIGRFTPITPVEQTNTFSASTPISSPNLPAVALASSIPCCPVQAFALPLFTTTPETGFLTTSISHNTGAAFTTFVVKQPAATQGFSLTITAISFFSFFIPTAAPPALNPIGAVTLAFISFIYKTS